MVNLFKIMSIFKTRNQNRGFTEQYYNKRYVTKPKNDICDTTFKQVLENAKKFI